MSKSFKPDIESDLYQAFGHGGSREAAARLLKAGAKADFKQRGPGGWTVRMNGYCYQRASLDLLLGYPQLNLADAAIDGDVAAVRRFIEEGASPNELECHNQYWPLRFAAGLGHAKVVALLLTLGARVNPGRLRVSNTPLISALKRGHLDCADILWAAGGFADEDDLLYEVHHGRSPVASLEWVLKNDPGCDMKRGLVYAIRYNQLESLAWMIRIGTDLHREPPLASVLIIAASYGRAEAMRMLIDAGADVHATDRDGQTAMHAALLYPDMDDDPEPDPGPVVFSYTPADVEKETVKILVEAGLEIPPPEG